MNNYITIEQAKDCCGCAACANACLRDAVTMQEDRAGFLFPAVDEALCVQCGKCLDVCVFTEKQKGANGEPSVYAAALKDREVLKNSSSGGVFTALANAVLDKGGAVFGAAWRDDPFSLGHIAVEDKEGLAKLRGSKYVQSFTGDTFRQVKSLLGEGRTVCYAGTPCQIAGLKGYLGKDDENLLTVDLVCHGVPSMKMLKDDLQYAARTDLANIREVKFRDKSYGWGVKGSLMAGNKKRRYDAGTSPYYFYFLKGELYRESCYHCRFPSEGRQGDITLGDYWGVRQDLVVKMGEVDPDLGVSCVLVNSEKGKRWFESVASALSTAPTDRKSVEKRNRQLIAHSVPLPEHQTLLEGYQTEGYLVFPRGYKKHGKDHLIRTVKNMIPSKIKRKLNDLLFRG